MGSMLSALSCVGARTKAPLANDRTCLPRLSAPSLTPPCGASQNDVTIPPEGVQQNSSSSNAPGTEEDSNTTSIFANDAATRESADPETKDASCGPRGTVPSVDAPSPEANPNASPGNPNASPAEHTQDEQRVVAE